MSSVDERIVEMRFENEQFEKGVDKSLKSLDKLKTGLNLDGAADSLNGLQTAAKGFDISHISDGVDKITQRFSLLGIMADQAIRSITTGLINLGQNALNTITDLTIDQVPVGFSKYERKIGSVQTIMNATGKDINTVNDSLDKLNWYTDETSYSFTDMVDNIGKFTSSGVLLDEAVTSMIGIANAAGYAGANVQDASHAMEGFSKAMGQGYMSRQNWQWIRTAHMDTVKFKEQMIEAALAERTLTAVTKKVGKEMQTTYYVADKNGRAIKNMAVSVEDFESNLAKGWLTKNVMNRALANYGQFTETIYDEYLRTGDLTSDIIERLDDGTENLGLKAFRASQEAKTFSDAINSVKDAVSTGWMVSFEQIFGNYEEAKKLWTTVANELWDVFASGGEYRNEMLKEWHDRGGYDVTLRAIRNIWDATKAMGETIKEAFREFFPPMTADRLRSFSNKLYKFSVLAKTAFTTTSLDELGVKLKNTYSGIELDGFIERNKKAAENIFNLKNIFTGLFSVIKLGTTVLSSFGEILSPLGRLFGATGKSIFELAGHLGKFISTTVDSIITSETYSKIVNKLTGYVDKFTSFILDSAKGVKSFINAFMKSKVMTDFFDSIKSGVKDIKSRLLPYLTKAKNKLDDFFESLVGITSEDIEKAIEQVIDWFGRFSSKVKEIYSSIKSFLSPALGVLQAAYARLSPYLENAWNAVKNFWDNMIVGKQLGPYISNLLSNWKSDFEKLSNSAKTFIENFSFKDLWTDVKNFFTPAVEKIDTWISDTKKKLENLDLGKVAAVGLATAMIPTIISIGVAFSEAAKLLKSARGVTTNLQAILIKFKAGFKSKLTETAKAVTIFATAIGILAASFKLISTIDADKVQDSLKVFKWLGGGLAGITAVLGLMGKFNLLGDIKGVGLAMIEIAGAITILSASFLLLDQAKPERLNNSFVMILALMTTLLLYSAAMARIVPQMSKNSLTMLSFSASILILSEAMNRMSSNMKAENLENVLAAIVVLGAIMTAFSAMASNFKFGSGLSLITTIGSIFLLLKLFEKLSDDSIKTITDKASKNMGLIIGALVVVAALAGIGRIGGQYAAKTGTAILEMSASLLLVYMAVKKLGEMDTGVLLKGGAAVAAILLFFGSMAKSTMYAGQNSAKAGLAVMGMAAALLSVYLVTKKLGQLEPAVLIKGLTGVIPILGMFGLAVRSLRNLNGVKGAGFAMIGVAVVIGTIAAALSYLTLFSWSELSSSMGSLALTLLGVAAAMKVASLIKFEKGTGSIGGLIAGIIALVAVAAAIKILAKEDWASLQAASQGMSTVLMAISASMLVVSHTKFNWKSGLGQLLALGAGIGAFWVIGKILSKLAETDWSAFTPTMNSIIDAFDNIMIAVEAMSLTAAVLGHFDPSSVLAGMGEILLAMIGIAAVFLAIGWVNSIAGEGKIVEGAKTIGDAIGGFLGGIAGEGMESAASHLEAVGEYLTNFIEKAGGFFEGIKQLPPDMGTSMLNLTRALDNFSAMGKKINKGKDLGLDTIGAQLEALGKGISAFSDSTANVDLEGVKNAVAAGEVLNGLLSGVPSAGGVLQWLGGTKSWKTISTGLAQFGGALDSFSQNVQNVNSGKIENAVKAGEKLNGLLTNVPSADGIAQKLFGKTSWATISTGLADFGKAMSSFSSEAANISTANMDIGVSAGTALNTLLENLPQEPGKWDKFFGSEAPAWKTISEGLADFATAMVTFSNTIISGSFGPEFDNSISKIEDLSNVFDILSTGFGDFNAVYEITSGIQSLGSSLKEFDNFVVNLKAENLKKAIEFVTGITAMAGDFTSAGEKLGDALKTSLENALKPKSATEVGTAYIGAIISSFSDLSELTTAGTNIGTTLVEAVRAGAETMSDVGNAYVTAFTSSITLAAKLGALAAGVGLGAKAAEGANSGKEAMYEAGVNVGKGFVEGIRSMNGAAFGAGKSLGNSAVKGAMTATNEHSPSKVFMQIGEYCGEGLVIGFNNSTASVRAASVNLAKESIDASANVLKGFDSLSDINIETQPVITPVLDLSQVDLQAQRLDSILNNSATVSLSGRINNDRTTQNIDELIRVGSAILAEIQSGHDLYFDDGAFAGRINRRLGVKI